MEPAEMDVEPAEMEMEPAGIEMEPAGMEMVVNLNDAAVVANQNDAAVVGNQNAKRAYVKRRHSNDEARKTYKSGYDAQPERKAKRAAKQKEKRRLARLSKN